MTFSKGQALRFGWETTKKNLWYFVSILLIIAAISYVPSFIANGLNEQGGEGVAIIVAFISVASWIASIIVEVGLLSIMLSFVDGKKPNFSMLFAKRDPMLIIKFFAASVLYAIIVGVGLLLLVVPGIYFGVKFMFSSYFIVDKNVGPLEALKLSSKATSGAKWNLFLFMLLVIGINILGAIALLIGLFVTIPLTSLATVWVYRKLQSKANII